MFIGRPARETAWHVFSVDISQGGCRTTAAIPEKLKKIKKLQSRKQMRKEHSNLIAGLTNPQMGHNTERWVTGKAGVNGKRHGLMPSCV